MLLGFGLLAAALRQSRSLNSPYKNGSGRYGLKPYRCLNRSKIRDLETPLSASSAKKKAKRIRNGTKRLLGSLAGVLAERIVGISNTRIKIDYNVKVCHIQS